MHEFHRKLAVGVMAAVLVGCGDELDVTNPNNPDRDRALATPDAVEKLISDSYISVNQSTIGGGANPNDALQPQLLVMGNENFGVNANFGMNIRGVLPRQGIDNNRGNTYERGNFRDFNGLHRAARAAAIGYLATERPDFSLGSVGREVRARAFSLFVQGIAMGYLSLAYDSAAIIHKDDDVEIAPPPLVSYQEMNAAALQYIEEAITMSTADPSGFPLPATWLHTGAEVSHAGFVRVARSFQARFRANVARTPAERAAVDWARVISDATAGITEDLVMNMDPAQGRTASWFIQHFVGPQWHQMHQFMVFFADTTRAFDAWLAAPTGRTLVRTPDLRFPRGDTRAAQQASPGLYLRNRTAQDAPAPAYAESMYDHIRFLWFNAAALVGPIPIMTKAETDLLRAEGHYRLGQYAQAAPLINTYRTAAGLPAITAFDATSPVPGGDACVPRVPHQSQPTTSCADMLEALKWEYRMETAYTGYGNWFFPGRGWGDLPEGTPLHWAVPYQEMDARVRPFRSFIGGVGRDDAAAGPSTYGMERLAPAP